MVQGDPSGDAKGGGARHSDAEVRDDAADQRDHAADQRDQAGDQRDDAADQRDDAAKQRDDAAEQSEAATSAGTRTDAFTRSALARRQAASDRAAQDRGAGAGERTNAELDRDTALADRGASAREREHSSHDDLTGAYRRGAGFVELEREIARARRAEQPLVLAFIDVDQLKVINDSRGHAAGDRMLSRSSMASEPGCDPTTSSSGSAVTSSSVCSQVWIWPLRRSGSRSSTLRWPRPPVAGR